MPLIKFIKEKREIEVQRGANLRAEALRAGINLYPGFNGFGASLNKLLNCHGLGVCGTCRVNIVKGMENTSPLGTIEKARFRIPIPDPLPCLAYIGNQHQMRLACATEVNGDIEVETCPELNLFGDNFFS